MWFWTWLLNLFRLREDEGARNTRAAERQQIEDDEDEDEEDEDAPTY